MRWLRVILWGCVVFLVAACNLGPPQATPTVAPTNTPRPQTEVAIEPTRTPIIRFTSTPSITPFATITPIPSDTPTETLTPTDTPTGTQTPSVTPSDTSTPTITPSPTVTASNTPTPTFTPTNTPTNTLTPSDTPTGTQTPTATPSDTPTPTNTATPTITPSPTVTPSLTPSDTPTLTTTPSPTQPPTVTPIIILDTDTPTPTNTAIPTITPLPTITPSLTPTNTPTATFTPLPIETSTPNLTATINAEILMTRAAPTFTAIPQASPTNTIIPPTLDVTPTIFTATPSQFETLPPLETPPTQAISTPQIVPDAPTATATPLSFPTPFPQEQIPPTIVVTSRAEQPLPTFNNANTTAYSFNVGSGGFTFNGITLQGAVGLFAANPAGGGSFARTDGAGYLTFAPIGGSEGGLITSPFFSGFTAPSAEGNKNYVRDLAWSPNGQHLSFLISPFEVGGQDYQNAGVWYWDAATNAAYPLLHDCPRDFYSSCQSNLTRPANHWQSIDVEWSPDSTRALITVRLLDEGRQGIFIANAIPNENIAQNPPPMYRFDNGQWLDNGRILVSGRTEDGGNTFVGIYNLREETYEGTLFDGNANGIAIADAVQRPNNQIVALGRPGDLNGALQLYRIDNGTATPISGFVADRYPDRIEWAGNYAEVVLTFGGQQVSINTTTGAIVNVNTSGAVRVNQSSATGGQVSDSGSGSLPTGVVAGNRYDAGQQIQYIGGIPRNMRQQPSVAAGVTGIVNQGEFVSVLAGPVIADGYEWWFVSNARNVQAWMSTHSNDGGVFFSP